MQFCGGLYHITTRGNERKDIFRNDKDRKHYLKTLIRYKEELKFYLYCYMLMPNHTHLLIETPLGNIAKIMLCVNTNYTTYFNKKYNRVGHLFQGRYKSIIVDKENYLLELIRYIHLNPVRAGIVERPEDYKWSSHKKYLGGVDRTGLICVATVLSHFGATMAQGIQNYQDFVNSGVSDEDVEIKNGQFIGKDAFIQGLMDKMGLNKKQIGNEGTEKRKLGPDKIVGVVSKESGLSVAEIRLSRAHDAVKIRDMAIWVARRLSGKTLREIGEYFGGIKHQTVSKAIERIERSKKLKEMAEKYLAKVEG